MSDRTYHLDGPDATHSLGVALGRLLFPGAVVALVGQLGAGKTHFARGVAAGLGVDPRAVTSPTFVLVQEYDGRLPAYHFDVYRLAGTAPFADLGAHEYLEGEGVCLIEWADRVEAALPSERLTITLEVTGEESRRATLSARGPRYVALVDSLPNLSG